MPDVEFGSRDTANAFREDHEQHLCSQDDRRKKTVTLVEDAPDRVLDEAAINEIHQQYGRDLVSFEELGERRLTPDDIDWNS